MLFGQAWKDTTSVFGWNLQAVVMIPIYIASVAVLWKWKGLEAVRDELPAMLSFAACLLLGGLFVFLINVLLVSPYRLYNALRIEEGITIEENQSLKERLRPTLIVEVRDADNRYLVKREVHAGDQLLGRSYSGRFSVSNPPNNLQSIRGVAVIIKDILGCGTDFRDVKLRFIGQMDAIPIDINPGETKFIEFVSYYDQPGGNNDFLIAHTGVEGTYGVSTPIQKAGGYVAKIHVTGTNMPLISKLITFGINCGEFSLSMRD